MCQMQAPSICLSRAAFPYHIRQQASNSASRASGWWSLSPVLFSSYCQRMQRLAIRVQSQRLLNSTAQEKLVSLSSMNQNTVNTAPAPSPSIEFQTKKTRKKEKGSWTKLIIMWLSCTFSTKNNESCLCTKIEKLETMPPFFLDENKKKIHGLTR